MIVCVCGWVWFIIEIENLSTQFGKFSRLCACAVKCIQLQARNQSKFTLRATEINIFINLYRIQYVFMFSGEFCYLFLFLLTVIGCFSSNNTVKFDSFQIGGEDMWCCFLFIVKAKWIVTHPILNNCKTQTTSRYVQLN